MAGQTLTTTILINAKAEGLAEVGNTLMELSGLVSEISSGAQNTLKDSTEVYRNYEKSMAEARGALATNYGIGANDLEKVMVSLDEAAQDWAGNTIFHTNEVGSAIADAAHAGWSYEQIMADMPAVMQLAQAGNMDLAETVSYITASMRAAGVEVDELDSFIDAWAYSANSSRGTIREFGDTFTRMQSTMRFTENTAELMTLVAAIADMGSTGSEAGTMIRNAILRLAAPTDKAGKLMDSLGVSASEMNEAMTLEEGVMGVETAGEQLQQFGFSAYDTQGKLKPVLQQFSELYGILSEMAGEEEIIKSKATVPVLETIFGKRGIIAGVDLLQAASENYGGLYESLISGEQEGYAAWLQETMWNTLDNKIEAFKSKVEKLQNVIGEELSSDLQGLMSTFGEFINSLSEMDDVQLSLFVGALETLAALGPGLMLVGGGIAAITKIKKLLAFSEMAPVIMGATALAGAIAFVVHTSQKLWEIDYEDKFGNLKLDNTDIVSFANGISQEFNSAYDSIIAAQGALDDLQGKYETKSADLIKNLMTDMVTGKKWTAEDKEKISTALNELIALGMENLDVDQQAMMASLAKTFEGDEDNPAYTGLQQTLQEGYNEAIASAEGLSQQLLNAMFSAFEDGTMTASKLAQIQDIMRQLNDEVIAAEGEEAYIAADKVLRDAQRLGLEGIQEISDEIVSAREATLEPMYREHARVRYRTEQEGGDLESLIAEQRLEEAREEARYNIPLLRGYMSGMAGSDLSGEWQGLLSIINSGGVPTNAQWSQYARSLDPGELSHLQTYITTLVDAMGGVSNLTSSIDLFNANGESSLAKDYQNLLGMYNLVNSGFDRDVVDTTNVVDAATALQTAVSAANTTLPELARISAEAFEGETINWDMYGEGLASALRGAAAEAGQSIPDYLKRFEVEAEVTELTRSADIDAAPIEVEADAQVNTDAAQGEIDALDGQELMENVDGDVSGLSSAIDSQDGRTITTHVNGDTSGLRNAIAALSHQTVYVNVARRMLFAAGGRATEASIFGEAGPEWAIPEEHSQRTAELLDAARQASGFTWPDLLGRLGGLNANTENSPATIVYSPTIHANDASGVDAVLREDKFRLERWFEERQMRDRMEVYA